MSTGRMASVLIVVGVSHHDLDLGTLDRLVAAGAGLSPTLAEWSAAPDSAVRGAVVLTTCNRLEVYLDAVRFHDAIDAVTAEIGCRADVPDAAALLKVRVGAPVAAHLFRVASGLDAMVVGEVEISGQVGAAHAAAQRAGLTTPVLHALFQAAARVAKQVTTRTGLGTAGRSIASVAIELAMTGAVPATALLIGTGAYARVAATALRAGGCRTLRVHSPSGRADAFAARHQAETVTADGLAAAIADADLVVCASGHGVVVTADLLHRAGRRAELPIVDLALHGDVAPDVARLPGVRLIDLHAVATDRPEHAGGALTAAQDLIIAAVARFEDEQVARTLDPAVVALRRHVRGAVDRELDRLRAKYPADVAGDVELALHRVTQSLLHTPTLRARELARTGDAANYLQALHVLFGIEIPEPEGPAADR